MSKKICTVLLLLVCMAGGALSVFLYIISDHSGPDIQISEERVTYREDSGTDRLLDGVTAVDNVDGDVTDSLMVEAVYPSADEKKAKVIYAAMDSSNNVSKAQRIVDYIPAGSESIAADNTEPEEQQEMTVAVGLQEEETETASETEEQKRFLDAKIALINGSDRVGVSAKWQEKFQEDGYTDVVIGSYSGIISDTTIYAEDAELISELKDYFTDAREEKDMPEQGVDISLEQVDACVIISEKDAEE